MNDKNYKLSAKTKELISNELKNQLSDIVRDVMQSMRRIEVPFIKLSETATVPSQANPGDAGYDLRANIPNESISILPNSSALIPTGISVELPIGFELQVRSRSGLAAKNKIQVLNSPGTVDSGYRGEIKVILFNHGPESFQINHNDRIAQAVIAQHTDVIFVETQTLSESERGIQGMGSSGVK